MILSGLLLLAVYDGLGLISKGLSLSEEQIKYDYLDWYEHYEIMAFRSDSVRIVGNMNLFYVDGEPVDTLMNYGF